MTAKEFEQRRRSIKKSVKNMLKHDTPIRPEDTQYARALAYAQQSNPKLKSLKFKK